MFGQAGLAIRACISDVANCGGLCFPAQYSPVRFTKVFSAAEENLDRQLAILPKIFSEIKISRLDLLNKLLHP